MSDPTQAPKPEPLTPQERGKRGGNPILRQWKATGTVPDGYYIDEKKRLRKKPDVLPDRVEVAFDRLAAMRHVLSNPASTDRTEGERACRAWLARSPGPFMETLDRLEAEAAKKPEATKGEGRVARSEKDDELDELIEEVLDRLRKKQGLPPVSETDREADG